jgi:hypothetical protein
MHHLSKVDVNFLMFGDGSTVVERKPILIRQGNGNFTGAVRTTFSNGRVSDREFVVNAPDRDYVVAAYGRLSVTSSE